MDAVKSKSKYIFWHDSTPEIVENTRRLIDELLSNEELILLIEIVDKIIRYDGNLHYNSILYDDDYYDEYEKKKHELKLIEIDKIICDELTTKFLRYKIKYKSDDPSKIDKITDIEFTEQFRQLVGRISELITFDETTGFIRIVPGTHTSITLLNLHFRSILELERLQQLEYTGKYLIQYFGLNLDNSIIGRYFSTKTTKLTKVSPNNYMLNIDTNLDYTADDKIFAVNQKNPKNNIKGRVISYNKQTGELIIERIYIADGFRNIDDDKIIYKVSKIDLSVFVKVDLIRLVILMEQITKNPNSYAIYADLDSHGLDESFIFNEESMRLLDAHGLVLPLGQSQFYENSFHILAGENLTCDNYMIIAIQKILIDFNIKKIIHGYTLDPQEIFNLYKDLFTYYFIIKKITTEKFYYHPEIIDKLNKSNKLDLLLRKEGRFLLDQDTLLHLNIDQIANILFSGKIETKQIGFFSKTIFIDGYRKFLPVRIDLGNLSPHRSPMASYDKKYLLL